MAIVLRDRDTRQEARVIFGATRAPDLVPAPLTYEPEADVERDRREAAAHPFGLRMAEAISAARAVRVRTDLTSAERQKRQMLADYRVARAEAAFLYARLLAWHPELVPDDEPLRVLRGAAGDVFRVACAFEDHLPAYAGTLHVAAEEIERALVLLGDGEP